MPEAIESQVATMHALSNLIYTGAEIFGDLNLR